MFPTKIAWPRGGIDGHTHEWNLVYDATRWIRCTQPHQLSSIDETDVCWQLVFGSYTWNSVESDSHGARRTVDDAIVRRRWRRCWWMDAIGRLAAGRVSCVSPGHPHLQAGANQGCLIISWRVLLFCIVHYCSQCGVRTDDESIVARRSNTKWSPGHSVVSVMQCGRAGLFRHQYHSRDEGHCSRIHSSPECSPPDQSRRSIINGWR